MPPQQPDTSQRALQIPAKYVAGEYFAPCCHATYETLHAVRESTAYCGCFLRARVADNLAIHVCVAIKNVLSAADWLDK